jgi:predicted metal-dependent enzyme (double-stranded beta helix superfamily)
MHAIEEAPPLRRSVFGGQTRELSDSAAWAVAGKAGPVKLPANLSPHECLRALRERFDFARVARFSAQSYVRTRIHRDDTREVYVMGWLPGQFSSIHDHGAAPCAYEVLRGCLQEEIFRLRGPGEAPELLEACAWPAGSRLSRQANAVHRCGNAQSSGAPLVTLHVYDHPARDARTYDAG